MQGILFIIYILILSGVIATVGDRLGYRIGKKRLSWFNLRPRHTAVVVTILTGIFISASSIVVLLVVNESLADGLFRYSEQVEEYKQQISDLEANIDTNQVQLANLETQQQEALAQVEQLTEQQGELQAERDRLLEQQQAVEAQLAAVNDQLEGAQASLEAARQQIVATEAEANAARDRVEQLQASLQDSEADLADLQTQRVGLEGEIFDLEDEISALTDAAQRLRRGEFAILAGETLATGVIEGGLTPGDIQRGLNQLFAVAERRARELGAVPAESEELAIQIPVPEVTRTIQEAAPEGSWVVQVFSLTNRLVGEPVPVITTVLPNRLLFPAGTVLAEAEIAPGESEAVLESSLVRLFVEAGQRSRNEGILVSASTGSVGEFSQARLFELVRELGEIDESTIVQVVTEKDIYTAGPLEVDIAMHERVENAAGQRTRWGINDRT